MLFVSQEERRASNTVLFACENDDIANQSVDTSFFTSEKKSYDQSAGFSSAKRLFYLDAFLARKSRQVHNKYRSMREDKNRERHYEECR